MSAPAGLRSLQRWFLDEVTRVEALPRPPRRGRDARAEIDARVLPSPTLTPAARVAIYGRMYAARLEECLRADHPGLLALLGPARFSRLARRFVTKCPPSSWTLDDLGRRFPEFVAEGRSLPRRALARDVARLERAMSECLDAEDAPSLAAKDLEGLPPGAWPGLRLRPSPSLRVLALATDANRAVTLAREGRPLPRALPPGPTWVAVYRGKDLRVWRLDLTSPMHAALSALARGRPLGAALEAAARAYRGAPERLPSLVRGWFTAWVADGLFSGIAPETTA